MVKIDDADMAAKWHRIAARGDRDVCRSALAEWDDRRGVYAVAFLDRRLEVDPARRTVNLANAAGKPSNDDPKRDVALLALEYLANAKAVPPAGRWVTGKELPNGAFFFRGPHEVPSELVAKRFGNSPAEFVEKAKHLGGVAVESTDVPGDAAVCFRVLPRIDVMIVLWAADDEFDARATILFDASIAEHLLLDGVFLLALTLVLMLIRQS